MRKKFMRGIQCATMAAFAATSGDLSAAPIPPPLGEGASPIRADITSFEELVPLYLSERDLFLPLFPPTGDTVLLTPRYASFSTALLPSSLLAPATAHECACNVTAWRVYVGEEETEWGTLRTVTSDAGDLLWTQLAPAGYDPWSALFAVFPTLTESDAGGDASAI